MLPEAKPSSCIYGVTDASYFGGEIPIGGAAGDQQSALFGQTCFQAGEAEYVRHGLLSVDEYGRETGVFESMD